MSEYDQIRANFIFRAANEIETREAEKLAEMKDLEANSISIEGETEQNEKKEEECKQVLVFLKKVKLSDGKL
jgi:hypothetical protein